MSGLAGSWNRLSTNLQTAILTVGAVDAALRVWALVDLMRRSGAEVRGPKWLWATGLSLVSSAGALPAAYLPLGRQRE